jgi:sarcosine oxidase gamma subunit
MDDHANPYGDVRAEGIEVRIDRRLRVAALRYFDRDGAFARQCRSVFGVALPETQRAVEVPGAPAGQECILAWRHPTQTLAMVSDGEAFATLQSELSSSDGCCIDQSGGVWVLRVSGARVQDLLVRIGGLASTPRPGEAHVTRIAELAVLSVCVKPAEVLLVIDRAYAEHLLNWIRATVQDFGVVSAGI